MEALDTTPAIRECSLTTCQTQYEFFLERVLNALNVMIIPLIVGPKNSFTKWLHLPKAPGIFAAEQRKTLTLLEDLHANNREDLNKWMIQTVLEECVMPFRTSKTSYG